MWERLWRSRSLLDGSAFVSIDDFRLPEKVGMRSRITLGQGYSGTRNDSTQTRVQQNSNLVLTQFILKGSAGTAGKNVNIENTENNPRR